jgi:hypothetical protein
MSGLQLFVAFMLGGGVGIGATVAIFALREARRLSAEDIDRLWLEACNDMSSDVLGSFARRVEEFVTQ